MGYSYMTREGYQKLVDKINQMESIERPEISRQIAEARDKGDLSENAEYDAAKEAQGLLEAKIAQLKQQLAEARIIDETQINTETVQILTRVTLRNCKDGKEIAYTLVSDSEANLREGKISINTPIARGLMGKKVGEIANITVPSGEVSFEILDISLGV